MHVYYRDGEELALNISGITSPGYSESALRFGLMDVRPIEVIDTIKKFGMKFRVITRHFQSLKPSQSFEDFVAFENEAIFGSVSIPEWFKAGKLIKTYSQRSIDNYNNDAKLQNEIEEMRKTKRMGRPLLSFIQFMKLRFESRRDRYLEIEAHRFLDSNFPLSFYNKLVVFDNTYYDFLRIVEDIVRIHEFRATYSRNFDMYKKHISAMKRSLSPLIDQLDKCSFYSSCLKKYISIWNSKDYKEIFYPKFLDIKNVDLSELGRLRKNYGTSLKEARAFLLKHNPEILKKTIDSEDPTMKMFGKLVSFPSSSLAIKR